MESVFRTDYSPFPYYGKSGGACSVLYCFRSAKNYGDFWAAAHRQQLTKNWPGQNVCP